MLKLSRIIRKHWARFKAIWTKPLTMVYFDRKGPNQYIRRTDGHVFTLWQLGQLYKGAAERKEFFIVCRWSDIPIASSEDDVIM